MTAISSPRYILYTLSLILSSVYDKSHVVSSTSDKFDVEIIANYYEDGFHDDDDDDNSSNSNNNNNDKSDFEEDGLHRYGAMIDDVCYYVNESIGDALTNTDDFDANDDRIYRENSTATSNSNNNSFSSVLPSEVEMFKMMKARIYNLPSMSFEHVEEEFNRTDVSICAKCPNIYDLEFNNIYWQTLLTTNGTLLYLYGAYYDVRLKRRKIDNDNNTFVRILAIANKSPSPNRLYCQLRYAEYYSAVIVETLSFVYMWHPLWWSDDGRISSTPSSASANKPYLISCNVPSEYSDLVPISVSLTENVCDSATNNLKVIYNEREDDDYDDDGREKKNKFAVCVKGLNFPFDDYSVRLVEWIELLSELGVDKIFFYTLNVHSNIVKVLDYYERRGLADVTDLTLPGGQPNAPAEFQYYYLKNRKHRKRQNELIPYNDCLYRNMYRYDYVVPLDVDEIIVPIRFYTWNELIAKIDSNRNISNKTNNDDRRPVSYCARNVYFPDEFEPLTSFGSNDDDNDIPFYTHVLRHVYRREFSKPYISSKCFHKSDAILTLHNHYPLECLNRACKIEEINVNEAKLQHYRSKDNATDISNSSNIIGNNKFVKKKQFLDTTVWKYKYQLISRTRYTLNQLGLLK